MVAIAARPSRIPVPVEQLPGIRFDDDVATYVRGCRDCSEEWPWSAEYFAVSGRRRDGSPKLSTRCLACSIADLQSRAG